MSRLFLSDKEIDLFNKLNEEMLSNFTGQYIYFHEIDSQKTSTHPLYDEANGVIIFKQPKKIHALVNISELDNFFEQAQVKEDSIIEVYMTKKTFDTLGVIEPRELIGNYISWGDKFYEIAKCVSPQLIYGEPDWRFGVNLTCDFTDKINTNQYEAIESSFSNPNPPLTFTSVGTTSVTLNWIASTGNFSGYIILRNEGSPVTSTIAADQFYQVSDIIGNSIIVYKDTGTTYTDGNLNPNTTYYYKVFTYN